MAGIDWWFALQSRYSGWIPQINVLMGPCIAGQAYCPTLCDFLLMSRGTAHLWLDGVSEAVALRGGRIRPQVAIVKSLASAICIGTGGSVGREGPIIQIAAAMASGGPPVGGAVSRCSWQPMQASVWWGCTYVRLRIVCTAIPRSSRA